MQRSILPPITLKVYAKGSYKTNKLNSISILTETFFSTQIRPVLPSVQQGYLNVLPDHVPERPESWKDVMNDIHDKIVPGVTNWQSPQFHAYFPLSTSYSSIVGDIIANAFGGAVFSWVRNFPFSNTFEITHQVII